MVQRRSYGQSCGVAWALDVIGERWTLLIIRELLISARRYQELLHSLRGIGPNVLSDRLRYLSTVRILSWRDVESDRRGKLYYLTERGEALRDAVLDLARWGLSYPPEDDVDEGSVEPAWGFLALQAMASSHRAESYPDEAWEFRIQGETFHLKLVSGVVQSGYGPADDPSLVVACDAATFMRIGAAQLDPISSVASGLIKVQGDAEAMQRCLTVLGLATMRGQLAS